MTEEATVIESEETTTTATEVTAEAIAQQGDENVEKVNAVNTETENDDDDLAAFYEGYKPMATTTPDVEVEGEAAKQLVTQLKEENMALIEQVNTLTTQLTTVNQIMEHPTFQTAKAMIEKGEDASTSKFIEVARMSNPHTMTVEMVYEKQMRDYLTKKGFASEDINEKVIDALDRFADKDDYEKEVMTNPFREKLIADFDHKTQEFLGVTEGQRKKYAIEEKQLIANANVIQAEISRIAKEGRFGVFTVDENWKKQAEQVNVFRHDEKGRIDVAHAIKVINYALNPETVEKELIRYGKKK